MDIVNEKTTCIVTFTFTDEDNNPVTPTAATYRIDDVQTGTSIVTTTGFTPLSSTYDLEVQYSNNKIINTSSVTEYRNITVDFTYGAGNKHGTSEYVFGVKNLKGVS
jgi:hypothetical protein